MTERRGIQSLDVAGRLFEAFCLTDGPATLKELSALANMPPSKAHRYVSSLVRIGLAKQNTETGLYDLGPLAMRMGLEALARSDIIEAASKCLSELAQLTGLSAHLSVWSDRGPLIIRLKHGRLPVITTLGLGSALPLTGSATGLLFATFIEESLTKPVMDSEFATRNSPLKRSDMTKLIKDTRAKGYSTVDSLFIPGLIAISAPVFNWQNELACAITLVSTQSDIMDAQSEPLRLLLQTCEEITQEHR